MRKHSVRKWIHAICDLLPLFTIPIFALAVRSDNNYQPISINYGGGYEVTPKYQTNEVNSYNDLVLGNVYHSDLLGLTDDLVSDYYTITILSFEDARGFNFYAFDDAQYYEYNSNENNAVLYYCEPSYSLINFSNYNAYISYELGNQSIDFIDCDFIIDEGLEDFVAMQQAVGSDITSSTFQSYNVSYVEGVVYNDTDVGSQMVYTLYNTCDKYFNFNQVGTFNDIYGWFETNMFHGTAPLSFFIVWNVILYEFIMDLIFLTYMVFMFVIDFTEHLIDGFFDKAYRGGR